MSQSLRILSRSLLAILALSCVGPEVSLLEDDDSAERLRRMNLVVEVNNGGSWTTEERTIDDVQGYVNDHCITTVEETAAMDGCFPSSSTTCDERTCDAQLELCRALTFRELAQAVSRVSLYDTSATPVEKYRVPPQDAESRVALEQAAQYAAMLAMTHVKSALLTGPPPLYNPAPCLAGELEAQFSEGTDTLEQSTGELLASTLVEALQVGEAAADSGRLGGSLRGTRKSVESRCASEVDRS